MSCSNFDEYVCYAAFDVLAIFHGIVDFSFKRIACLLCSPAAFTERSIDPVNTKVDYYHRLLPPFFFGQRLKRKKVRLPFLNGGCRDANEPDRTPFRREC